VKTPLIAAAALALLTSCLPREDTTGGGLPGYDPTGGEAPRAACEARGGTYARAGLAGGLVCVTPTPDAGKSCTSASACDGLCLARSRSCAPVKPLFGCNDILTDNGTAATLCID